jgi:hypothetical protein
MSIDKIQSESINLSDNFAFTGTVTGAGGITNFDQWMMSDNKSHGSTSTWIDITADLQRMAYGGAGSPIGTGMTESSGIFTFPTTGKYLITAFASHYIVNSTSSHVGIAIQTTTDNSSYNIVAQQYGSIPSQWQPPSTSYLFDVTNTSTHKVKFSTNVANTSVILVGGTSGQMTHFDFFRVSDT